MLFGPYKMHLRVLIRLDDVTAKPLHHFLKTLVVRENARGKEEGLENITPIYTKGTKEDSGNCRAVAVP